MTKQPSGFGILGLGMAVPETVRTNDWWPKSFVERFEERAKRDVTTPEVHLERALTRGQRIQAEEMLKTYGDPFRGSKERRIAAPGDRSVDYEIDAARKALEDARTSPSEIDFVIASSSPSDEWTPGNGFALQHELGTRQAPVLTIDPGCAAFVTALGLADALLLAGRARKVLIVVSGLVSRITDWNDPASVAFGDAAAAAVVGPTRGNAGFLAHAAGAEGCYYRGLLVGPKSGGAWYEGAGRLVLHSRDFDLGRSVVMQTTHYAELAVDAVLDLAGLDRKQVMAFYCHQASSWFNAACRRAAALEHCKTVDTFEQYASAGAANVPLNLIHARAEGQLGRGDDVVLLFSLGIGIAWASCLMRWSC